MNWIIKFNQNIGEASGRNMVTFSFRLRIKIDNNYLFIGLTNLRVLFLFLFDISYAYKVLSM